MLYQRLIRSPPSIRLLQIFPSNIENGPIICQFKSFPLDDTPKYIALSYRWAETSDTTNITINQFNIYARTNLVSALRHLRTTISRRPRLLPSYVWADAICINQDDEVEINEQVQIMGSIYSRASTVISWLGSNPNRSMSLTIKAIESIAHEAANSHDWLRDLSWMRKYPWLSEYNHNQDNILNEAWRSIVSFFSDEYWRRVWVLQEMVLSQSLLIMIGRDIISYESVKLLVELINHLSSLPNPASANLPHELWYYLSIPGSIDTTTHLLVEEFKGYAERIDEMSDVEKLEAVFSAWPYQATNPKDKFFALQGVFKNFIIPDYKKSIAEVYSGAMSKWISYTKDLDLLRYAGIIVAHSVSIPDLPSWTPNWQGISSIERWQPFPTRGYSSDDDLSGFCGQDPEVLNDRYLRVEGCICDTIVDEETCCNLRSVDFGRLYQRYTSNGANLVYPTGATMLQAILRTILSDNYQYTATQPDTFDSVSAQCSFLVTIGALTLSRNSASGTPLESIRSSIEEIGIAQSNHIISFLKLLVPEEKIKNCWQSDLETERQVILHRRFVMQQLLSCFDEGHCLFRTSQGYLGSAAVGVQVGDTVCVIQGCSCPVILRKTGSHWMHVGTCFVLGFMNGEVAIGLESGSMTIENFEVY